VSELDSIQGALGRAAARRRWLRSWNGLWRGLFAGAVVWLLALAAFKLAPVPSTILTGALALAGLLTLGGFLHGWFHRPTLEQTARWVDDHQRLQERLSTALELGKSGANENWRLLLMADAARFASKLDVRKLLPFHLPRATRWADNPVAIADMQRKVPQTMTECFSLIESDMLAGPWVMGESYTICDPYLYTISGWLPSDSVDLARFPRVNEHRRRMEERPAVKRALAEHQVAAAA